MVAKEQALELTVEEQSLTQIEHFVDHLCDKLMINDAYYGNILMSLNEFFSLLVDIKQQKSVKVAYTTDYQRLTVRFSPISVDIIDVLSSEVDLTNVVDSEVNKRIFILNKLVDNLIKEESGVSLVFDISALHSIVYDDRKKKLQAFYKKKEKKTIADSND